jgi:hypothetical protein
METIAFYSEITDHTIAIPERYWQTIASSAFVTITVDAENPPRIIPRIKKGAITIEDIGKPFIHTKDWKFDREEANER